MTEQMHESYASIYDIGKAVKLPEKETVNYEFLKYENQGSNLNSVTQYRLWSTDTSSFMYLGGAMVQVDVDLLQVAGGARVTLANQVALTSNPYAIFESARLRLNDIEVASLQRPGRGSLLRNLVESGRDYIQTVGQNGGYYIDEASDNGVGIVFANLPAAGTAGSNVGMYHGITVTQSAAGFTSCVLNPDYDSTFKTRVDQGVVGTTRLMLSLADIFPMLSSVDRVVRGVKLEVEFDKISNVASAVFCGTNITPFIDIKRMQLWVPRVTPSLQSMKHIEMQVSANPVVQHDYENMRTYSQPFLAGSQGQQVWRIDNLQNKPNRVYCTFQRQTRDTSPQLNTSEFDALGVGNAVDITRLELMVNGRSVTSIPYNPQTDTCRILHDIYRIGRKDSEDSAIVTAKNWASLYPIFAFDLSTLQVGGPYESKGACNLELTFNTAGATTYAYNAIACVISDASALFDSSSGTTVIRLQ